MDLQRRCTNIVISIRLLEPHHLPEHLVLNATVDSTTPDTAFRWSSTDQLWIFNLSTKNLTNNERMVLLQGDPCSAGPSSFMITFGLK